jgi:uncharacterized protein
MQLPFVKHLLALTLATLALTAQAAGTDIPAQEHPVTDLTGTLSSTDLGALNTKAAEVKTKTGVQMAVLLTPSIGDESLDAYSDRAAKTWNLGNNGNKAVLLTVAFTEHGVRLVATRNIADHLDTDRANDIISSALVPAFRQGHIPAGISKAMDAVQADLAGPSILLPQVPPVTATGPAPASRPGDGASAASAPPAGNWFNRMVATDSLAVGLIGSATLLLAIFFIAVRIRSDRALRRSVVRAHAQKAAAAQVRLQDGVTARSALDKALERNPGAPTSTLAKSRLAGLRDAAEVAGTAEPVEAPADSQTAKSDDTGS